MENKITKQICGNCKAFFSWREFLHFSKKNKTWLLFFLIVVQVQLSPFSTHHSLPPHPSPPSTLKPTPYGFVHVSFIHVPWLPFPYFPHYPSPLAFQFPSSCSLFQCLWSYFACLYHNFLPTHLHSRILHSRKKEGTPTFGQHGWNWRALC